MKSSLWLAGVVIVACTHPDLPRVTPPPPSDARPSDAVALASVPPGLRLPEGVTPLAYDLRLELDPDRESFEGKVEIRIRIDKPTDHVWLHLVDLELESARFRAGSRSGVLSMLDTASADTTPDSTRDSTRAFGFGASLAGEVTLVFDYTGHPSTEEEGLFRQQSGARWFLYSQSESMFARRILPCFDEPRWKPAWRVTLVVPAGLVALGNGATVSELVLADGRHEVKLAEVSPMPSYLFAVAVGPFTLVDAGRVGRGKVPVRVAVAAEDAKRVGVVAARLPAVIDALERYLDRALPLAKLDLVAIPRFFGAMENTGLITFEASILVGDSKDISVARRFIRFAAHELAHQWFGNLVTPAWWDDLWLSEGFASWLGEKVSAEVGGFDDPGLRAQLARLEALEADGEPEPRPLHPPIAIIDDAEDRFDAISYEKGGAVLAMFEQFVGAVPFRDAIRRYLDAHRDATATSADFVAALESISTSAVGKAFMSYLDRPGAPIVELAVQCGSAPAIELHARDGAQVPVCVRIANGKGSSRACVIVIDRARIPLAGCPAWVIGNESGAGYYRVAAPLASTAPRSFVEQLAHTDDLAAALLRDEISLADALREVKRLAATRDPISQLAALSIVAAIDPLVDDANRAAWTSWLAARFGGRLGPGPMLVPNGAVEIELRDQLAQLVGARARLDSAVIAGARALVDRALAKDLTLRDFALAIAAPRGSRVLFDRVVEAASLTSGARREHLLESLGAFGPELAPRLVELMLDSKFKPALVWPAVAAMLARPETRTAAWRAVGDRLAKLVARLAATELEQVIEATRPLCDSTARADVAAAFGSHTATLAPVLAAIDRCIVRRARLGDLAAELR